MDVSKNKSEIKDGKLTIDPLLVTNEQIDDYRLQYPKSQDPGKIFTNELVSIYEKVFEKEIEKAPDFLSYPLLLSVSKLVVSPSNHSVFGNFFL